MYFITDSMSCTKHQQFLNNHCRVCGKLFGKNTIYPCGKYASVIELFGVDPTKDDEEVHPGSYCNSCYLTAKRASRSGSVTTHNHPIRTCVEWIPHDDNHCDVCDVLSKGGRPKKSKSGGRPSLLTSHIRSVACSFPSFSLYQVIDKSYIDNITCHLCNVAVNEPIEVLPCKSLICCSCLLSHLKNLMGTFCCPGCDENHVLVPSSFSKMSQVAEKMMKNMIVKCNKCYRPVKLSISQNPCSQHTDESLLQLVSHPLESMPTTFEKQIATRVITRLLHHNDSTVLSLPTGGKVSASWVFKYMHEHNTYLLKIFLAFKSCQIDDINYPIWWVFRRNCKKK